MSAKAMTQSTPLRFGHLRIVSDNEHPRIGAAQPVGSGVVLMRYAPGEVIFAAGEAGETCFKIVTGRVEIRAAANASRRREAMTCDAGEIAALSGATRSSTAVAIEPATCLVYTADALAKSLEADADEALAYVESFVRRLRRSSRQIFMGISDDGPDDQQGGVICLEPTLSLACCIEEILTVLETDRTEAVRFAATLVANLRQARANEKAGGETRAPAANGWERTLAV